jgi:hypothetical protein
MENKKNELDDLLQHAMQFADGEIPEPDAAIHKKLRKRVGARRVYKNPFVKLMNINVKLYQAAITVVGVAILCFVLKPVSIPANNNINDIQAPDTATVFKGSSLKNDSFLVKNFTSTIY